MISPFADPEYKPETYYYTDAIADHAVRFIGDHHKDQPASRSSSTSRSRPPTGRCTPAGGHRQVQGQVRRRLRADPQGAASSRPTKLGLIDPKLAAVAAGGRLGQRARTRSGRRACMEVYAAMIDRMDQGIGRIVARAETHRPARQHADPVPAGQRRRVPERRAAPATRTTRTSSGPTKPTLPVDDADDLLPPASVPAADARRLPGPHGAEGACPAGRTRTSPTAGLGERLEHAVPRVQALGPRGRHLDAADRPLAGGHRRQGRVAPAARAPDRHHGDVRRPAPARSTADDSGTAQPMHAAGGQEPGAGVRRQADRARRDLLGARGQPGGARRRLEAGREGAGRRSGSCTTWRPTAQSCTTWPRSSRRR